MNGHLEPGRWIPGPDPCLRCGGCGQIATDDDRSPWWQWAALPTPSNLAVILGMVRPEPCPVCGGTGKTSAPDDAAGS